VMITGCIDLSLGTTISLTSIALAKIMVLPWNPALAIGLGAGCGMGFPIVIGALNGGLVGFLGVPPFLATLGMMFAVEGATYMLSSGMPVYGLPRAFTSLAGSASLFPLALTAAAVVAVIIYMGSTVGGRRLYAVGGNSKAARTVGILAHRTWIRGYVLAGCLVGIAAVLLTARVSSGEPMLGRSLMLESIAAAVLGGVSIKGGSGKIVGAVIAAIFIRFLRNGMDLANVSGYLQQLLLGAILVAAVVFSANTGKQRS